MSHLELLSPSPDCFCYTCQAWAGVEGFITAEMFIRAGTYIPTAYYCGDIKVETEFETTAPIEAESVSDLFKDFGFDKIIGNFGPVPAPAPGSIPSGQGQYWNTPGIGGNPNVIHSPGLPPFKASGVPLQCAECGHTLPSHWPSCSMNYRTIPSGPSVTSPWRSSVQGEFNTAQDTAYDSLS